MRFCSVPVRGHCVFWGRLFLSPEWLWPLRGEEMYTEIDRRMDYLVPHYNGRCVCVCARQVYVCVCERQVRVCDFRSAKPMNP